MNKKAKTTQPGLGPSDDCIRAQTTQSDYPKQRPLTLLSDTPVNSTSDKQSDANTELYSANEDQADDEENIDMPKGKFNITTKSLKKSKTYDCVLCDKTCNDATSLSAHQQECHKIMYCKKCSRAFNNQTTYKRHVCSHSKDGVSCDICGKRFAYQSQLNTHSTVHSTD